MNKPSKPSTYSLNQKQLYILKLAHKFRYITAPLLAQHRNTLPWTANSALTTLYKKGYLGRHYSPKANKLPNKPAVYYLANKGIRHLRAHTGVSPQSLNACYKDKHFNQKFIDTSLHIYRTFLQLRVSHPGYLFFTANDLRQYDHYPKPLPNLYFHKDTPSGSRQEYMLDIFEDTLFFYIKKRIDQYITHYDSDDWLTRQYPTVILVVADSRLKAKAMKCFESARDGILADEVELPFGVVASSVKYN